MPTLPRSCWKITHGTGAAAVVLLDFEDWVVGGDIDMSWQKQVDAAPRVRADAVAVFDRKNVSNELGWERIITHSSLAAALEWRMSHAAELQRLSVADLYIQPQGGNEYVLRGSLVTTGNSRAGAAVSLLGERSSSIRYQVIGGTLERSVV